MKDWEKAFLAERVKFYALQGYDKSETVSKCVRLGFKEATARRYYTIFMEDINVHQTVLTDKEEGK